MSQYKAAVIGLGQIGMMYDFDPKRERPSSHTLAYKLHSDIELVAAADSRIEQADFLDKIAPEVRFYQDMEEMLIKHSLDVVSICTPVAHHLGCIQNVLQIASPKIIFCEKPLAFNLIQVKKLKDLLSKHNCFLIPNLSRRWNKGMQRVKEHISCGRYGSLQKVNIRYTRGIINTGAHVFDLLNWWGGQIENVQVIEKVNTSADYDGEQSFTFIFQLGENISGFAEAFNDEQYYLFEIDLYCSQGKIEIRNSGDDVIYYGVAEHHLFSGFKSLHLDRHESNLLAEANLGNAVNHLVKVLDGLEQPICKVDDGIYPLYVSEALLRSHHNNCSKERVIL
jgi:predicted dehydrogenase